MIHMLEPEHGNVEVIKNWSEIFWCGLDFAVFSALQLNDCTEFKVIDPKDYDRDISSINDITKRPLGYMFGIAKYRGV